MYINVYYKDKICGKITVLNDDLMMKFIADCDILSLDITRIYIKNEAETIPLGILMPKNNRYTLTKKIPISHMKKYDIDNFSAYIVCENEMNFSENAIIKETIKDINLAKIISNKISKKSYENYDIYEFTYQKNIKFMFEFCVFACDIRRSDDNYYIQIKTNKKGEILV